MLDPSSRLDQTALETKPIKITCEMFATNRLTNQKNMINYDY